MKLSIFSKYDFKHADYLDPFFIIDPSNHLYTDLWYFGKFCLLQTDISEDFDDTFSHTYASILQEYIKHIYNHFIIR